MSYETLIRRINENQVLKPAIQDLLEDDRDTLNLIHPDWNDRLLNDVLFQNYKNGKIPFDPIVKNTHIHTQRVKPGKEMKILIVGHFSLVATNRPNASISSGNSISLINTGTTRIENKPPATRSVSFFSNQNCPPLSEIGLVFKEGTEAIEYCDNAKFYIPTCQLSLCRYCPDYVKEHNIPHDRQKEWWCIPKTKIFNGDALKLVSRSTIEKDFTMGNFMAIFSLVLTHRQFYGPDFKRMKLNGQVHDMILFKESCLEPRKNIKIEFLPDFRSETPVTGNTTTAAAAAAAATTRYGNDPTQSDTFELVPNPPKMDSFFQKNGTHPSLEHVKDTETQNNENQTTTTSSSTTTTSTCSADDDRASPSLLSNLEESSEIDCIPEAYSKKRGRDDADTEEANEFHQADEVKRFKLT